MLARLWRRPEQEPEAAPKPLPLLVVSNPCPEPLPEALPETEGAQRGRSRRQKRVRVCRLYARPKPAAEIHARELLAFIQSFARDECPEHIGGYVPWLDLDRYYQEDLCKSKSWEPLHWTAIARELSRLTHKKTVRQNGDRFVAYKIPRPS